MASHHFRFEGKEGEIRTSQRVRWGEGQAGIIMSVRGSVVQRKTDRGIERERARERERENERERRRLVDRQSVIHDSPLPENTSSCFAPSPLKISALPLPSFFPEFVASSPSQFQSSKIFELTCAAGGDLIAPKLPRGASVTPYLRLGTWDP